MTGARLAFDNRGVASLDGSWDFLPGDRPVEEIERATDVEPITVPGLWEAQGWLDLDGTAWYRRRFELDDPSGGWTLRFGAVMDLTTVFVNGRHVGGHELAFTPLEVDPAPALVPGTNTLAVRVVDPALADADHVRMAHGKQGWANHVFPSRPSLYMTYGGIWQPVTLRRHGPLVVRDVFVNSDPAGLVATAEIENRGPAVSVRVLFRTLGMARERQLRLAPGQTALAQVGFGPIDPVGAPRWRPEHPVLHELSVDVSDEHRVSDTTSVRYGLRTVRLEGKRLLVNDEPYRMRSVLVQGFTADRLYAEGSTSQIRAEVEAARAMGFNFLRLHIKAFDPRYLEACDDLGILVHCDIPVAEPIVHQEMGTTSLLARRCLSAARAQVRRDRNHPSVVLWSAMNEICDGLREARRWPEYEAFARALYTAVCGEDPTRPVIENDWVEPDPDRVFESPILTAHWYGRLHREYLDKIERAADRWAAVDRPLFVTEFGDWGLPQMPLVADPPFWDTRAVYAASLADTLWPATVGRFVGETQRYQGLSDRLQAEVFRRHDGIGGYCLTELTDVPIELNGLLDLQRRPKPMACAEMARVNQAVLPMLRLHSFVAAAGQVVRAPVYLANDGPALGEVTVECRFGESASPMRMDELLAVTTADLPSEQIAGRFRESVAEVSVGEVAAHTVVSVGEVSMLAPEVAGSHDLVLRLRGPGEPRSENRYPVHVVRFRPAEVTVRRLGGSGSDAALRAAGATRGEGMAAVVAEDDLDSVAGAEVRAVLDRGGAVLILAQEPAAGPYFPVPTRLEELATAWGSTVFAFTTDHGAVPSLPRRNVLVAEDSTISAHSVVAAVEGRPFPDTPVVIAYKPVPNAVTGAVIGAHAVGSGRLVFCQYRLADAAADGDPAALAMLADLLRWIAVPRPVLSRRDVTKDDGRALFEYAWRDDVGR